MGDDGVEQQKRILNRRASVLECGLNAANYRFWRQHVPSAQSNLRALVSVKKQQRVVSHF